MNRRRDAAPSPTRDDGRRRRRVGRGHDRPCRQRRATRAGRQDLLGASQLDQVAGPDEDDEDRRADDAQDDPDLELARGDDHAGR